jgi:hypothetical protein
MPLKKGGRAPADAGGTGPSSPFCDADPPRLTGSPNGYLAQRVEGTVTGAGRKPDSATAKRPLSSLLMRFMTSLSDLTVADGRGDLREA